MVETLTEDKFESDVLTSPEPVVLQFFATWCGPSRRMSQEIDRTADIWSDKIRFFRADIDECPELTRKYAVRSIPSLFVFYNGELVNRQSGFPSQPVNDWISRYAACE